MQTLRHDNLITHSKFAMAAGGFMGFWEFIFTLNWVAIISVLIAAAGFGVTLYYTKKKVNHELRLKDEEAARQREFHEARMAQFKGSCHSEKL